MRGQAPLGTADLGPAQRLTLPAICVGRCEPRWKLPAIPYLWIMMVLIPAVLLAILGFSFLVVELPDRDDWANRGRAFLLTVSLVGLFTVPAALWVRHLYRERRQILAGLRIPVTVYYGRLLDRTFPVAPRLRFRYRTPLFGHLLAQPLLLLVAADGRMWTATPDLVSDHDRVATTSRNNPWIAPLLAFRDDDDKPVVDLAAAQRRRLPVDLNAEPNWPVLRMLRGLGQPDPEDPPEARQVDLYRNDPKTYGGPIPGELLVPSEGRFAGLIFHRPASAPATSTLEKRYWSIEFYFFGTDPGECRGIYLKELALVQQA